MQETESDGVQKVHWSSRFTFLMAAIGFAVGLGNIWRFPYVTGENGGAVFVLVYLVCALVIGLPILMAEVLIGRRGGASPYGSMAGLAAEEHRSPNWRWVGGINLLTAFLIEIVYCVIAGWVLAYLAQALLTGFADTDPAAASGSFTALLASPAALVGWTLLALGLTGTIIYAGVQAGIERAVRILMPLLFVLLLGLAGYNLVALPEGFRAAWHYLVQADWSKLHAGMVLAAVGQAFFSIGVAMAGMLTFGAYLPARESIAANGLIIVLADTLVALVAGFVIFPLVFSYGMDPRAGTGLIFETLPVAFGQMPVGHLISVLFFLLLGVAAITSMVGLIEPLVVWLQVQRGYSRHRSTAIVLLAVGVGSLVSVLSYNLLASCQLFGRSPGDWIDFLANQFLLPVGGLLIAVFAGWVLSRAATAGELRLAQPLLYGLWRLLIRFVVPPAVLLILIFGLMG